MHHTRPGPGDGREGREARQEAPVRGPQELLDKKGSTYYSFYSLLGYNLINSLSKTWKSESGKMGALLESVKVNLKLSRNDDNSEQPHATFLEININKHCLTRTRRRMRRQKSTSGGPRPRTS